MMFLITYKNDILKTQPSSVLSQEVMICSSHEIGCVWFSQIQSHLYFEGLKRYRLSVRWKNQKRKTLLSRE